jgi:hypothetical protein
LPRRAQARDGLRPLACVLACLLKTACLLKFLTLWPHAHALATHRLPRLPPARRHPGGGLPHRRQRQRCALSHAPRSTRCRDACPFRGAFALSGSHTACFPSPPRRPAAYLDSTPGNIGSAADIYTVRAGAAPHARAARGLLTPPSRHPSLFAFPGLPG